MPVNPRIKWFCLAFGDQGDALRTSVGNQDERALLSLLWQRKLCSCHFLFLFFGQESSSVTRSETEPWNAHIYTLCEHALSTIKQCFGHGSLSVSGLITREVA